MSSESTGAEGEFRAGAGEKGPLVGPGLRPQDGRLAVGESDGKE